MDTTEHLPFAVIARSPDGREFVIARTRSRGSAEQLVELRRRAGSSHTYRVTETVTKEQ